MIDKYTVRDFLVYFLTGLFLIVTLINELGIVLLEYFQITKVDIKENSALVVFLLIPGLYILGHVVHGIDLLTFKVGRYIWDLKDRYALTLKNNKLLWLFNILNFTLNGNRVSGILNAKSQNTHEFWQRVSKLQYKGKFDKAEYWNLMNDLFKGLTLISFGWIIYHVVQHDKIYIFVNIGITFLFWYRARHMATNFVATVNNTWDAIDE